MHAPQFCSHFDKIRSLDEVVRVQALGRQRNELNRLYKMNEAGIFEEEDEKRRRRMAQGTKRNKMLFKFISLDRWIFSAFFLVWTSL